MLKLCPSWEKPLSEGIPCVVFRRELEAACPELPAFLTKAGNQSHDVHSKETNVQLMLSLNPLFVAQKRFSGTCGPPAASALPHATPSAAAMSWDSVAQEMEITKPHFSGCAKEAAAFASAWSGGDFAKSLKVRRELEDGQLGLLAGARLTRAPKWPIACLKAVLSAPELFCRWGGG